MGRITILSAVVWCTVCFECRVVAAADGAPMFVRVTVLEAAGVAGPFDATIVVKRVHRAPWAGTVPVVFGQLALGQRSAWVDLSGAIADKRDVVTAVLSLAVRGEAVKQSTRARVELARAGDAQAEPLALIEVADPGGVMGFVMPERGVADADVAGRFAGIADIARRHLAASDAFGLTADEAPKQFVAAARAFQHGSYTDPTIIETEVKAVQRLGYNTLVEISADLAEKMGVPYVGGADYRPPGMGANGIDEEALLEHYRARGKYLLDRYGSTDRFRAFAMSDEPSWDFPQTSERLNKDPLAVERFREYLRGKGLSLEQLGKLSWGDATLALPPGDDATLGDRRLWYHTIRFSGHEQAARYAAAARAVRAGLGDQVLAFTNWNNPGIVYSDVRPWHGGVLTASHDWFMFSRAGGSTCLWLGPGISEGGGWYRSTFRTWSLMLNLLRSAADQGVGRFGAYVHHNFIPDDRGYEVALSIMAVAGHGGAGYNSYIWGPHYAFTEYMWSEKYGHYEHVADANRLIGRSERLMIGARPPKAEVALLWPITSMIYDLNQKGYWTYNRDYLVEMQQVWFALNHHNIPVDFVDETMVGAGALDQYKVLYLTGPNVERGSAEAIRQWVDRGGRLWTCAAAAMRDEYNQPMDVLDGVLGVAGRKLVRRIDTDYSPKGGLRGLEPLATVEMSAPGGAVGDEPWKAYGSQAAFELAGGAAVGRFGDGTPAVVRHAFGEGESLHFATMPGLAYSRGATEVSGRPTVDYPPRIAKLIAAPANESGVRRPAVTSLPFVEATVLRSDKGVAVTLLNWSGEPLDSVEVEVSDVGAFEVVTSARHGAVDYRKEDGRITAALPMPRVIDVLMVE